MCGLVRIYVIFVVLATIIHTCYLARGIHSFLRPGSVLGFLRCRSGYVHVNNECRKIRETPKTSQVTRNQTLSNVSKSEIFNNTATAVDQQWTSKVDKSQTIINAPEPEIFNSSAKVVDKPRSSKVEINQTIISVPEPEIFNISTKVVDKASTSEVETNETLSNIPLTEIFNSSANGAKV